MHKKFEMNQTKIKDGCQSGSKVVTHNSKKDLPLTKPMTAPSYIMIFNFSFPFSVGHSVEMITEAHPTEKSGFQVYKISRNHRIHVLILNT